MKIIKYVNVNCNVDENLSSCERRGDFTILEDTFFTQKDINTYERIFSPNVITTDITNGTNIYLHNIKYPRHILSSYQKNRLRDHGDIIKFVRKPNKTNLIVLENISDYKLNFEKIYISKRLIDNVDDPLYFLGFDDNNNKIPVYTLLKGILVDDRGVILNYKKRSDSEIIGSFNRVLADDINVQNYLDILEIDSQSKFSIKLMSRENLNSIITTIKKPLTYADVINIEAMLTNGSHEEIATSNLLSFSSTIESNKFWFEYLFKMYSSKIKNTTIYKDMRSKNIIPNLTYINSLSSYSTTNTINELKETLFDEIRKSNLTIPYDIDIISKIRVIEKLLNVDISSGLKNNYEQSLLDSFRVSINVNLESELYNIKPKSLYMNFNI